MMEVMTKLLTIRMARAFQEACHHKDLSTEISVVVIHRLPLAFRGILVVAHRHRLHQAQVTLEVVNHRSALHRSVGFPFQRGHQEPTAD